MQKKNIKIPGNSPNKLTYKQLPTFAISRVFTHERTCLRKYASYGRVFVKKIHIFYRVRLNFKLMPKSCVVVG